MSHPIKRSFPFYSTQNIEPPKKKLKVEPIEPPKPPVAPVAPESTLASSNSVSHLNSPSLSENPGDKSPLSRISQITSVLSVRGTNEQTFSEKDATKPSSQTVPAPKTTQDSNSCTSHHLKKTEEALSDESITGEVDKDPCVSFDDLEKTYSDLFTNPFIVEFKRDGVFNDELITDVDMGCCAFVDGDKVLGATRISTCFAVCIKGKNANYEVKLGMYYMTSLEEEEATIQYLMEHLIEGGYDQEIELYIVGGQLPAEEALEDFPGTFEREKAILKLSEAGYPIKGVRLHLTQSEDDIDVLFTPKKIYYARGLYDV